MNHNPRNHADGFSPEDDPQAEFTLEDQRLLDLLVDGELDEPRRRTLLLSFDQKPAGWRRCALAFLEAQSWRGSFAGLLSERPADRALLEKALLQTDSKSVALPVSPQQQPSPVVPSHTLSAHSVPALNVRTAPLARSKWKQSLGYFAVAASMLLAFTLGIALRNSYDPAAGPGGAGEYYQPEFAQGPKSSLNSGGYQQAATLRNLPDAAGDNARFVLDGDGGGERTVDVRLIDDPTLAGGYPFQGQSAIPAEVLRELEKMGHQIEHQRRFAPIELQDGHRVLVPVEDVKIVPRQRQLY